MSSTTTAIGGICVAGLLLVCSSWAQANHPIELRWQAPASCPTGAAVIGTVERLLGGRPTGHKRVYVDAQVRGAGKNWSLEMVIYNDAGEGERNVAGASCREVVNAAALIIALSFDADAVAATQRGESHQLDPPTTPPVPTGPTALPTASQPVLPPVQPLPWARQPGVADGYVPPPPPSRPRKRLWFSFAPRLDMDLGTLPKAALGFGGNLSLRWYPFLARMRGNYFVAQTETITDRAAGGELDLWVLAPGICLTPFHTATYGRRRTLDFALDGCLDVEIGEMRANGFGVRTPSSGSAFWIAPHAQLSAALTLSERLSARAMIGLGVPIRRPDFVLNQVGVVHAASPVVGRIGLEIAVVF